MTRHSFVVGVAALCALAAVSFAQAGNSPAASSLQSLGAADPASTTHFTVYLPLTNQAALEQLVNDQTNAASRTSSVTGSLSLLAQTPVREE